MSLVLHIGHCQFWLGVEPRWPFQMHAGRIRDTDRTFGLTIELY